MAKNSFSKLSVLFRKFGGFRLFGAYARLGVLRNALKEFLMGVLKHKPADEIYYSYEPKIIAALQKRYRPLMLEKLSSYEVNPMSRIRSNIVWFCWFQGIDNAPSIVKRCLASLKKYLPNREIRIVDDNNLYQYVTFPDVIQKRWKKGQIPPAQFSDLLRLELLIRYGGTWIDSTVLCTGANYLPECLDSDLFFFQFKKGEGAPFAGISNWFITACQNNPLLMTLRDMLYAYWKDFDSIVEYFIFHRFFDMIAEEKPEEVSKMPYSYSPNSLALGHNLDKTFNQEKWDKHVDRVAFHKLAYQLDDKVISDLNNYYNHIVRVDTTSFS